MAVLSQNDHRFWEENGYVVIHHAVPRENLDAVVDAIWEFLGMHRDDPDDWYREPARIGRMVELYQHQALWNNRQYPHVYQAFAEIFGTEKLWVSHDRANMKPPARADKPEWDRGGGLHWDLDFSHLPVQARQMKVPKVQGVLYLTDTAENQGGFICVPGFHRQCAQWVKTQPDPQKPDANQFKPQARPIVGKAGDLVIWNSLLPHGNGRNTSDRIRLAQYITMFPNQQTDEFERQTRIQRWKQHLPGWMGKGPKDRERKMYKDPAELTELGNRLLGLELWG